MTMPGGGQSDTTRTVSVQLNAPVDPYISGMNQAAAATNNTASAVDTLDQKVKNLGQHIQSSLSTLSKVDFGGLTAGTAAAATFDKQLGTLNASAAITHQSMAGIKGAVSSAFTSLPASRTSIIQLIQTINELGITGPRQLGQLAQTFTKLGEATGEGPSQLAQGLVQLSRMMGSTNAGQIANYANSLLVVSKNAGVSATGVLDFAQSIAPMARQAGIGEAAVLGISAAFSKAGADGGRAANTFNQIIGDITQLTQTGSPQLEKYASLLGITLNQFKALPATSQIEGIFGAIAKGGPNAVNFVNSQGYGSYAISSIQAVAQSGGLQQAINQATGASTGTKQLNAGAKAATDNLADSLTRLRNEFTQTGTEIGESFQKPMIEGADAATQLMKALDALVRPLAPVVALLGAVGGAVAGIAGGVAGMSHLVIAGGLANMLIRGGPSKALKGGYAAGRGQVEGNASAEMYASGSMPLRARLPYLVGHGAGQLRGPMSEEEEAGAGGPGFLRQAGRMAVRAPGMLVAGVTRNQSRFLNDAGQRDPYQRSAYDEARPGAGAGPGQMSLFGGGAAAEDTAATEEETVARKGAIASIREWTSNQMAANKASLENESTLKAFGATMIDATKAVTEFGLQTVKTAGSLVGGMVRGPVGNLDEAAAGTGMLSRLGAGAKGAAGMLGGPLGIALLGSAFYPQIKSMLGTGEQNTTQSDISLNPIKQYNDALGLSTTKLADFSNTVTQAAQSVAAQSTTWSQATEVTPTGIAASTGAKNTDQFVKSLTNISKGNVPAAQALLSAYGVNQPQQLAMFGQNLLSAGWTPGQVQNVIGGFQPGGAVDYSQLAKTASAGSPGDVASKSSNQITGAALTALSVNKQTDLGSHNAAYAQTKYLQGAMQYLGGLTGPNTNPGSDKVLANALAELTGGSTGTIQKSIGTRQAQMLASGSESTRQQGILSILNNTSSGKQFLKSITSAGGTTDLSKISSVLGSNTGSGSQSQQNLVGQYGGLGKYYSTNTTVQAAAGSQSGSIATQQKAIEALAAEADKASGSYSKGSAALSKLADTLGESSQTVQGQLVEGAASWSRTLQGFQLPYQNRGAQTQALASNLQTSKAAAQAPLASTATQQTYTSDLNAYQQNLQAQTQYETQSYQQAVQYQEQMQRSQQDYETQVYRSNRDFYIQQEQAAQDYQTQTYRTNRDFNRQNQQQTAQTAQTIYNPYQRVQAVFTVDSGTLEQNLLSQNDLIKRQTSDLNQLKAAGLSLEAIQTLDLADPSNAQQTDQLLYSAKADPSVIGQLNAATATRMTLTKNLTQSSFNLQFAQSTQNFQTGLSDASADYDRQRTRAVQQQQLALDDMSTDYNRMIARSAQDLTLSMTEIYGSFADNYGKTLKAINDDIGQYAPELAQTLTKELKQVHDAIDATVSPAVTAAITPGQAKAQRTTSGHGSATSGAHAMGVISTVAHLAQISEGNRPEMILPLDARGQQFMASLYDGITQNLVKTLSARGFATPASGAAAGGQQVVHLDQSTNFTGPVSVAAQNVDDFSNQLQAKARLSRLARPQGMVSSPS